VLARKCQSRLIADAIILRKDRFLDQGPGESYRILNGVGMNQAMFKSLRLAIFGLVLMIGFQNCTASHFSSDGNQEQNKTSGSNGGFDGKVFAHFGGCNGDATAADTRIEVANDLQTISLVRSECEDLPAPNANIVADFDLTGLTHDVIYDTKTHQIFDVEVTSGTQESTKVICEDYNRAVLPLLKVFSTPTAGTQTYTAELDLQATAPLIYSVGLVPTGGGFYIAGYPEAGTYTKAQPPTLTLSVTTQDYLSYSDGTNTQHDLNVQCFADESLGTAIPTPAARYNGSHDGRSKYYVMGGK
jgi:hypothetical protein